MFDLNDFDETLPGPFEWDVKRLAASFAVATRESGFSDKERRKVVMTAVGSYRKAMREFARQPTLAVWYARAGHRVLSRRASASSFKPARLKNTDAALAKARSRDSMQAVSKLTTVVDGQVRFRNDPPLVVPIEDLFGGVDSGRVVQRDPGPRPQVPPVAAVRSASSARAVRVRAHGAQGRRRGQCRDASIRSCCSTAATASTRWCSRPRRRSARCSPTTSGRSKYANEGERVVAGQHLMQAVSDIFLGWNRGTGADGVQRDFYIRQLRDGKFSIPVEELLPQGMARLRPGVRLDAGAGSRPVG